jgi:hypothetical protein
MGGSQTHGNSKPLKSAIACSQQEGGFSSTGRPSSGLSPCLKLTALPENPILNFKRGTIQSEGGLHSPEFNLKLVALGSMGFIHNAVAKLTEPFFQSPNMFSHSLVHH